jgi:surface polysaccharide O-acyltransferase-like enzyme
MHAIAIIMVVAVHCIPEGQSDAAHVYTAFMKALLFPCNAVFFLLSGMFNLKPAYLDDLPHYYYRKIRNILIPALIFAHQHDI